MFRVAHNGWRFHYSSVLSGLRRAAIVPAVIALAAGGRAYAQQVTIPPGSDYLETTAGSTYIVIGGDSPIPPIPADFFFPGSEPYTGVIHLREAASGMASGERCGAVNTVVERLEAAEMPGPATVEVELKELSLVSVDPLPVEEIEHAKRALARTQKKLARTQKKKYYRVHVTINPDVPSVGYMTIEETAPGTDGGGIYSLSSAEGGGIYVYARFNFFEAWPSAVATGGPAQPIVWDPPDPLLLETLPGSPPSWQYQEPPSSCLLGNDFYPVPGEERTAVLDGGASGVHGFIPPRPAEACCTLYGECELMYPDDCLFYGGMPQGPGSVCLGDGDRNGVDDACEGKTIVIPPGMDYLETVAGTTWVEFGGNSQIPQIPAGFFFEGSQPYQGVVGLRGRPRETPPVCGSVNTVVERREAADLAGGSDTVEVELKELHLVSTERLVVLDDQTPPGEHYYDVEAAINPNMPSMGYMTIHGTHAGGGYAEMDAAGGGGIYLYARFNFFEAWPSRGATAGVVQPIVWDPPDPLLLETLTPMPWQYMEPALSCVLGNDYYPVEREKVYMLLDGGVSGEHGVVGPRPQDGCCLRDGECIDIDPEDCVILGGTPQGELCTSVIIACCLPAGTDPDCVDVDRLCCDDLGGTESPHAFACMGDLNNTGTDDACEPPTQACCLPRGACVDTGHTDCVNQGGDPRGPGTYCSTAKCVPLKWVQPPTFNPASPNPECFWGWDELSAYRGHQIVADDWLCDTAFPVTDVHWWGSYFNWDGQRPPLVAPESFQIAIWTDVPASVDVPFSHPGEMIRGFLIPRNAISETPVGCDCYPGLPCETCFRYDYKFSFVEPFFQEPACNIYWLSISAIYSGVVDRPNPWGWKTRQPSVYDDAVAIWSPTDPVVGSAFVSGAPIEEPAGVSWDMAFVLTTSMEDREGCCLDGKCLDLTPTSCRHFDGTPQGPGTGCVDMTIACCLQLGTEPDCVDVDPLCCDDLGGVESTYANACMGDANGNNIDDACKPATGVCCLPDDTCLITTEDDCLATGGVYGGDGSQCGGPAACCLPDGTCIDVDAVCCVIQHGGYPLGPGTDCTSTEVACNSVKWLQPPNLSRTGVDIRLGPDATSTRIIADNFECTEPSFITDVHLWTSWKDDQVGQITQIHLSIHANDPVGPVGTTPDNLFDQPDQAVLWAADFFPGEFTVLPFAQVKPGEWWWDAPTGELIQAGDTQVWQIDMDIDLAEAFYQKGTAAEPTTYWLAVRIASTGGELGWKTRRWPHPLNPDAVWDMGSELPRIWNELRYPPRHPYHGLERDSIDMAFALTTTVEPTGACCDKSIPECTDDVPESDCTEATPGRADKIAQDVPFEGKLWDLWWLLPPPDLLPGFNRVDIHVGKATQEFKLNPESPPIFICNDDFALRAVGAYKGHYKDVEVWSAEFKKKCAGSVSVYLQPLNPNNHPVIKEVFFSNTSDQHQWFKDTLCSEIRCEQAPFVESWESVGKHERGVPEDPGDIGLEIASDGLFSEPRRCADRIILSLSGPIDPATAIPANVACTGRDVGDNPVACSPMKVTTTAGDTQLVIDFNPKLTDFARYTVVVSGLRSPTGKAIVASKRCFTMLVGDANNNRRVTNGDLSFVRANRGALPTDVIDPANEDEVRSDVTCDGRVRNSDLSLVRSVRNNDARLIPCP